MADDKRQPISIECRLAAHRAGSSVIGMFIDVCEQFVAGEQEIVNFLFAKADEADPLFAERLQFWDGFDSDLAVETFRWSSAFICHKQSSCVVRVGTIPPKFPPFIFQVGKKGVVACGSINGFTSREIRDRRALSQA